jgi:hypothetical protein
VTLSVLVAIFVAIRAAVRRNYAGISRQRPRVWLVVLMPLAIFMASAMTGNIDIGIRHILPAISLLYLLAMLGLRRWRWPVVFAVLAGVACVETAVIHPDYQAFFNFASGGPSNGQRWLLDSNLDWGQDQARLADYLAKNAPGRFVSLCLFGSERPRDWPHIDRDHGGYDFMDPHYIGGLVAVSKNIRFNLYPIRYWGNGKWVTLRPVSVAGLRPNAHVGYSIDIYDFVHPLKSDDPDDRFAQ